MSKFAAFMKQNKKIKENTFFPATTSLCDESGNPLEWEIRPITSKENERIRQDNTQEVPTGKPGVFRQKVNTTKYIRDMVVASIVSPDLNDAELQDSYGVKKPDDLLLAMVDAPGEYNGLVEFIQKFNGFNVTFEDKVEAAKN